jgi:outer membrane protein TolC
MHKRTAFIIFFLFFLLGVDKLEAAKVLTWEECTNLAGEYNLDLVTVRAQLKQTEENLRVLRSADSPQLSSSASAKRAGSASNSGSDSYSLSVTGRQLLYDGSETKYNIAAAEKSYQASQFYYEVTASNVKLNLRQVFVGFLKDQELLKIAKDIVGRRQKSLELVELRYKAGREHIGALLTARANLARAEYELIAAKRNIVLAQKNLAKMIGQEGLVIASVAGKLAIEKPKTKKPDFESIAQNTPFLKDLAMKKDAASLNLKAQTAEYWPQVYGSANYSRAYAGSGASDSWNVGVSGSLTLWDGHSRQAGVEKSRWQLSEAAAKERDGRQSVVYTLMNTWFSWQNTLDYIEVRAKYLQAAEVRAEIAEAQYSTGLITFDSWIIIEDDLIAARKNMLTAKANVLLAKADWEQAKGDNPFPTFKVRRSTFKVSFF